MKMQRFKFLFVEYKIKSRLFSFSSIFKFEVVTFIVVVFHNSAGMQLVMITVATVLQGIELFLSQPFNEKIKYIYRSF